MILTAAEIEAATGGRLTGAPGDTPVASFAFDSRTVPAGACFVALPGGRDGHTFVVDAFARGARLAIVERVPEGAGDSPLVVVGDTAAALTELGREARRRLGATVVGVTGSVGKTSTKDLTGAVLSRAFATHVSPESFNNEAGVPLTLLGAPEDAEVVVAEMGARFAGNIADLAEVARPSVGIVTQVSLAHSEHLGPLPSIVAAKGELLEALPPSGLAVLNADDGYGPGMAARSPAPVLLVGRAASGDGAVRVTVLAVGRDLRPLVRVESPWGALEAVVGLRGVHQAQNAGLAAAVGLHLGVDPDDVAAGLGEAQGADHRMQVEGSSSGVIVVNDAYNANPASMRAAIAALRALPVDGRRVAVLGEMRELGSAAAAEHAGIGRLLGETGIDVLVAVGGGPVEEMAGEAGSAGVAVLAVADAAGAAAAVLEAVGPGDAVLVKASRAVGLEAVASALLAPGGARRLRAP